VQLVQTQLLPTAVTVLLRHLIFPSLGALLEQQELLVLKDLLVRTVLMVPMEAQTLF